MFQCGRFSETVPTGLPVGVKLGAVMSSQRPESSDASEPQPQEVLGAEHFPQLKALRGKRPGKRVGDQAHGVDN